MKLNLDLKQKPMSESVAGYDPDKPSFPSFTFETDEEHGLPARGTMVIAFEKASSTDETRNGQTRYRCTVDVKKIVSVEGGKSTDTEEGGTDETDQADEADGTDEASTERSPAVDAVLKKKGKKEAGGKRGPALASVLGDGDAESDSY